MFNKKFLFAATIAVSAFSFNALAKTEGNYVGLNLINTYGKTTVEVIGGSITHHEHSKFSVGADYKYAFNFNKFFIAPGIFFDNNDGSDDFALPETIRYSRKLKNSYGLKADFGYDITEKFSPFVTLGYSITRYSSSYYRGGYNLVKETASNEGLVYGLGLRYNLNKCWSAVAAYELTQFGLNSNLDAIVGGTDKLSYTYKVAKLGLAYNF